MKGNMKDEARRRYRQVREGLLEEERERIDAAIARNVLALPQFANANEVFTYLSVGSEVDTRSIIRAAWEAGKLVAVPRCLPGENVMEWHRISSFDGLVRGSFGIEEPPANPQTRMQVPSGSSSVVAVALVPGYSFDAKGFRLGYGGGFYDRFLPGFNGSSVGLCRARQLCDTSLAFDVHDVAVDIVVSEAGAFQVA